MFASQSVFRYWMCFLYLQEDLPYTEDLDDLGPLLGEDLPIDCATPSSSRLTHPPSSLLGSVFGCRLQIKIICILCILSLD